MSEKRRRPRAALDIYVNKIVDDQLFMCRATDISSEGIYLSSLIEPELDGKKVGVEFSLRPKGEVLWATGEIVREGLRGGAKGSGIRFTALPDTYRQIIESYIERRKSRPRRRRSCARKAAPRAAAAPSSEPASAEI
ncbi:MAG: PilZ domain-containing protein [Myxococcota bacterium]